MNRRSRGNVNLVLAMVIAALAVLIAVAVYFLSGDGGSRQPVSNIEQQTPKQGGKTSFTITNDQVEEAPKLELPEVQDKKPVITSVDFTFGMEEKGIGLTEQEQVEENLYDLLKQGDYEKADSIYQDYKVKHPDTEMAHRYPHLKEYFQNNSE